MVKNVNGRSVFYRDQNGESWVDEALERHEQRVDRRKYEYQNQLSKEENDRLKREIQKQEREETEKCRKEEAEEQKAAQQYEYQKRCWEKWRG